MNDMFNFENSRLYEVAGPQVLEAHRLRLQRIRKHYEWCPYVPFPKEPTRTVGLLTANEVCQIGVNWQHYPEGKCQ